MDLNEAINIVKSFKNESVKETLKDLERLEKTISFSNFESIFLAAKIIKDASSQIDEIVHASGIMIAKEVWLNEDEEVQYLSLGAGNHKERFDMETNLRIAEFKFGKWNDNSANGIRRRGYFSNYINLLTANDQRNKYFIVEDKKSFLKFVSGKATWRNVLSKNPSGFKKLEKFIIENKKEHLVTVGEIHKEFEELVAIIDYNQIIENIN
ncbi:hypothetical protein B0A79_22565 [Flavobacterium piscis]|uniref:Restriction endonuclease n=1 Tax=Flavobacterium piscis TaxID=1114874 RepID=A0ABX2XFK8_9FLAO|nr:hypothetical protein [Flavobacterium piscis]OCB71180.1 hypothetical protein FLP_16850 [Flavobacterium piscis]OXE96618.1 hypothetical protein B0A79_22565 [Flavobacterium piscis]